MLYSSLLILCGFRVMHPIPIYHLFPLHLSSVLATPSIKTKFRRKAKQREETKQNIIYINKRENFVMEAVV